ncbi:hypothetical protein FB45DRAFT_899790 [Roridomyces roridus]|uniref:Uncharacterized protein n=1 Tax=Roridomyces roridus TaxID=1738132 RepID=A0AAD7C7K3_9AGAR|nr:hypothetical protein FB45DRAFT_899790 [Roridomyces roridus]
MHPGHVSSTLFQPLTRARSPSPFNKDASPGHLPGTLIQSMHPSRPLVQSMFPVINKSLAPCIQAIHQGHALRTRTIQPGHSRGTLPPPIDPAIHSGQFIQHTSSAHTFPVNSVGTSFRSNHSDCVTSASFRSTHSVQHSFPASADSPFTRDTLAPGHVNDSPRTQITPSAHSLETRHQSIHREHSGHARVRPSQSMHPGHSLQSTRSRFQSVSPDHPSGPHLEQLTRDIRRFLGTRQPIHSARFSRAFPRDTHPSSASIPFPRDTSSARRPGTLDQPMHSALPLGSFLPRLVRARPSSQRACSQCLRTTTLRPFSRARPFSILLSANLPFIQVVRSSSRTIYPGRVSIYSRIHSLRIHTSRSKPI